MIDDLTFGMASIYLIEQRLPDGHIRCLNLLALVVMGDMTWPVPVAYTLHVFLPGALCAGTWCLRRTPPIP